MRHRGWGGGGGQGGVGVVDVLVGGDGGWRGGRGAEEDFSGGKDSRGTPLFANHGDAHRWLQKKRKKINQMHTKRMLNLLHKFTAGIYNEIHQFLKTLESEFKTFQ